MIQKNPSQIITFYSYKGGTGRSMALANVAWILASQGKRVLMVDWDLEAPGLHHYFHPFLQDKGLVASEGILDLVMKFEAAAIAPDRGDSHGVEWYRPFADISRYCVPVAWSFPGNGLLDLLPAGKQDPTYAMRVNSFNWSGFYDRLGGGVFLEAVKQSMRKRYDYILIDSRTGVSDTAGVCTVQMPDIVVVCFTYNIQSIEGAAAVAGSIKAQRDSVGDTLAASAGFRIFPVPMRVEGSEKEQLNRARTFAQRAFGGFIEHLPRPRHDDYWGEVYVPYESFYAYQEILATIADEPGVRGSILTSFERLVEFVCDEEVVERSPVETSTRQELKQLFLSGGQPRPLAAVLSHYPEFQGFVDEVIVRQKSWMQTGRAREYLLEPHHIERLGKTVELLVAMLQDSDFRDFWERSQRRLQQREAIRFLAKQLTVFAASGILLAALLVVGALDLFGSYPVYWNAGIGALAGILGKVVSSLVSYATEDAALGRTQIEAAGSVFWLRLPIGAMAGVVAALIVLGINYEAPIGSTIAYAFMAGFVSDRLVPVTVKISANLN